MIDRAPAVAEAPRLGTTERREHEGLGVSGGVGQVPPQTESGGDRRRERTPGAVVVRRRDARGIEDDDVARADEDIWSPILGR